MATMERPPLSPARTRESRTFSFRSDKSGGSNRKSELLESPREKEQRDRLWKNQSKANPNAAMVEAQPGDAAVSEKSTIEPLRGFQHRDVQGNPIVDPDRSNPTRSRMERPLDTIRSFEKAIDSGYKRRSSYNRAESYDQNQHARRSSAMGSSHDRPQYGGGYYGGQRPDSYLGGPRPRYGNTRMQSDPPVQGGRPYGHHGFQQSSHTMNTEASDSTGHWNSQTDPSSENSSLDRGPTAAKPQIGDAYGQTPHGGNNYHGNGYGPSVGGFQGPIYEEQSQGRYGGGHDQYDDGYGGQYSAQAQPVQPPATQRRPIPLGNSGNALPPASLPSNPRPEEKKKGWLSRRFSKRN